jgi:hypothetical protein
VREKLKRGEMILNLVAGVKDKVKAYFKRVKSELLPECPHRRVVSDHTKDGYFEQFSQALRETDILWTKPPELSFYAGLGIPLILTPTIGSHEEYNKKWLTEIHAALPQEDPRYTDEWLFDMLMDTRFAECALDGFMRVRKHGLFKILEVLKTGSLNEDLPSRSPYV